MVKGIDISAYQGYPDFRKVAKAGYEFVFIKATEGLGNRNLQQDIAQARSAKAAGLKVGYYHYARGEEARVEADAFISSVSAICKAIGSGPDFPLVLDIEEQRIKLKGKAFDEWVLTFEKRLALQGYKMWLYSYAPYLDFHTGGKLTHLPLWIAAYPAIFDPTRKPRLPRGWSDFVCWQYTGKGRVPGINGNVDLNVMKKTVFNK